MEHETDLSLFFWAATLFIFLFMMGIVYLSSVYIRSINKRKKEEFDNLLKASLAVEKRERKRIASDLHDSTIGDIASVRNYVHQYYLQEQDESKKKALHKIKTNLERILTNIQSISYNMMPPVLERLGLIPAIKNYFIRIREQNTLIIHEKYPIQQLPISNDDAYEVYRILQEIISNIIQHAQATNIDFSIQDKGEYYLIEICDDGIAYDFYTCLHHSSGMGLKNIISRIQQIEAELLQPVLDKRNCLHIHFKKNKQ